MQFYNRECYRYTHSTPPTDSSNWFDFLSAPIPTPSVGFLSGGGGGGGGGMSGLPPGFPQLTPAQMQQLQQMDPRMKALQIQRIMQQQAQMAGMGGMQGMQGMGGGGGPANMGMMSAAGMGMNMSGLQQQSAGTLVCPLFNISSIYLLFNSSFRP